MKFAIFHMEEIPTLFMLERAAKKVGFESYIFHLRDIRFFIDENGCDLRAGDISLRDFSIIFVRGFWNYQTEVSLLAKFCRRFNISLLDSALLREPIISKNDDLFRFSTSGLPVIKTIFLENKGVMATLIKEFSFPLVAKEIRGKRGFDVHLLKNKKQLQEFLRQMIPQEKTLDTKTYQFQKYIPADFDIRVLVLGGRVLGAIERRSNDPAEFRHNITLGGQAKNIPVTPLMKTLAIKAARLMNYEFAGVDFIIHRDTGKLYILEINRSPGFEGFMNATGIDVPLEVMKFFLAFCLKRHTMSAHHGITAPNRNTFARNLSRQTGS